MNSGLNFRDKNWWGLILGGSSGIGLATAKKLASHGMHLCIVHRDRRGSMERVEQEFAEVRRHGTQVLTINTNALSAEGRGEVLSQLADNLKGGKVRMMLHSIALGNLKLLAPYTDKREIQRDVLADRLGITTESLNKTLAQLDVHLLPDAALLESAPYDQEAFLSDEDFNQTVYNMATSLVPWVQDVFRRGMFAPDARVIGLTSEGSHVAWRGYAAVSCAKAALEAASRAIAREFGEHGVRCNIIQAGVTETPALDLIPGSRQIKAKALTRNPLGRLTVPQDVAGAVALLCTDEAAWINGATLRVDGGEQISG